MRGSKAKALRKIARTFATVKGTTYHRAQLVAQKRVPSTIPGQKWSIVPTIEETFSLTEGTARSEYQKLKTRYKGKRVSLSAWRRL